MPYAIISRSTNFSKGLQSYDKFNDRIIGKVDYNVDTRPKLPSQMRENNNEHPEPCYAVFDYVHAHRLLFYTETDAHPEHLYRHRELPRGFLTYFDQLLPCQVVSDLHDRRAESH
jgi:hypothetical protein